MTGLTRTLGAADRPPVEHLALRRRARTRRAALAAGLVLLLVGVEIAIALWR